MNAAPKRRVTLVLAALACLLLGYEPAAADVLLFESQSEFLARASFLSTETFDGFAPGTTFNTPAVVIGGVTYETDTTPPFWTVGIRLGAVGFVSPPNDFGANSIGTVRMSFGAGGSFDGLGFGFLSSSTFPRAFVVTVTEVGGQSEVFTVLSGQPSRYFGFLSDVGIISVAVSNTPGPTQSNFSFDDVSPSAVRRDVPAAVPEAGTLAMLCGSLSALMASLRVRRRRASRTGG